MEDQLRAHRCTCEADGPEPTVLLRAPHGICQELCRVRARTHVPAIQRRDQESQMAFLPACDMAAGGFPTR
jgi:hypothetical protein